MGSSVPSRPAATSGVPKPDINVRMVHPLVPTGRFVVCCLLLLGACSSVSDGDADAVGGSTEDQAAEDGASIDQQVDAGEFEGGGVSCGPVVISAEAIEAAEGRVQDGTVLAFSAVGLPLVAEELWSEVPTTGVVSADPSAVVVVDPDPIGQSATYWVRVAQPSQGTSFDGLCSFETPTEVADSAVAPTDCSIVADGISVTVVWSGADPASAIVVSRDL